MPMRFCLTLLVISVAAASIPATGEDTKPTTAAVRSRPRPTGKFELLDGDRVAFIGDALIERMQSNDYIETALTVRYPDRNITFRNLGWSGDTVFGDSRASFGTAEDGFKHLRGIVSEFKPTVVFLGYGGAHAFDGEAGLPRFVAGLETLVAMLSETKAAIVVLSPIRHEDLGRPFPDPAKHNVNRKLYRDALKKFAADRDFPFVDLFYPFGDEMETQMDWSRGPKLTDNGIHLTDFGYWWKAEEIEAQIDAGWTRPRWLVRIGTDGKIEDVVGTKLSSFETTASGGLKFTATDDRLPFPAYFLTGKVAVTRSMYLRNLAPGRYVLKIDGKVARIDSACAPEFQVNDKGALFPIMGGPEFDQVEELRKLIVAKNELFFHRWRPQNETYLFGFRKHEQGQNAREIPMFDPLVVAKEAALARLRVPVPHRYEIVRVP